MKVVVSLSSKGQVTLPAAIRATLRLRQGDRLQVSVDESNNSVTMTPVVDIEELSARVSGYARKHPPVIDVDAYYQRHRSAGTES